MDPAAAAEPAEPAEPAAPAAAAKRGPKAARFRSIRFKVVLMVAVSTVSLAVLWSFAANIALGEGLNLRHVETVQDHYGYPAGALGSALQEERRLSLVYLGAQNTGARAAMESGRLVTDRQADLFRGLAGHGDDHDVPDRTLRLADKVLQALDGLAERRRAIDSGSIDRARAFADYTALIADVGALHGSLVTLDNAEVARDARSQAELTEAREALAQETAWLAGALAAGRMTHAEHARFVQLVGAQRTLYEHAATDLRPDDRKYYERVVQFPAYRRLRTLEDHFIESRRAVAKAGEAGRLWKTTADSNLTRLRGLELSLAANAEKRAEPISDRIISRVVIAGLLGVFALVVSLVLAVWVARSIVRELARLRREAIDLADVRLPGVIARLRRGEQVDVAAEAPPLAFAAREIDEVGEAFNAARRTAIAEAVAEATLRRNVSEVFVNLARRSQTLLHRQLKLLDAMERRIEEPDDLEDLFRVDHLATRMRRHAEGLIILSGQPPGRGWRSPVAVVDVARAAASEVEDYTRVNVAPMTGAAVVGPAVADVIHLLAELIENAAVFSPPHTTVQVHGQAVAHGFTIEVEDRGLSMDAEALAAANERLATAAEFDLSDSAQLGLFVVGRLARRHGVKVTLRTSPYGGMTAIVLLPEGLVVRDGDPERPPAITTRRAQEALVPAGTVVPPPQAVEGRGSVLRLPAGRHATAQPTGRHAAAPPVGERDTPGKPTPSGPRRIIGTTEAPTAPADDSTTPTAPAPDAPEGGGWSGPSAPADDSAAPDASEGGGWSAPVGDFAAPAAAAADVPEDDGWSGPGADPTRTSEGALDDGPGTSGTGMSGISGGSGVDGTFASGEADGSSDAGANVAFGLEGDRGVSAMSDAGADAASGFGDGFGDSGTSGEDSAFVSGGMRGGPDVDETSVSGVEADHGAGSAFEPEGGLGTSGESGADPAFAAGDADGSSGVGANVTPGSGDGGKTPLPRRRPAASAWDHVPPTEQRSLGDVRRRTSGAERPPLPKRVRQENMAAQLRDDAAPESAPGEPEPPTRARRTPEEARAMMSSIQRGTRRGRAEIVDDEDSG